MGVGSAALACAGGRRSTAALSAIMVSSPVRTGSSDSRRRAAAGLGIGPWFWQHLVMTELDQAEGLTAGDVMHRHISTLPSSATVGDVRGYFAASASRRLALLAEGDRYVCSIPVMELPAEIDATDPAAVHAVPGPTIRPQASAVEARELALAHPSRRVPMVDENGALVGIVAINHQRSGFCGT